VQKDPISLVSVTIGLKNIELSKRTICENKNPITDKENHERIRGVHWGGGGVMLRGCQKKRRIVRRGTAKRRRQTIIAVEGLSLEDQSS